MGDQLQHKHTDHIDFLSYIFNVSENTKIIHLIMVIWLSSFIMSSFKLASGPPQDPGGSKRDIFKIKEMIHRIFSVKISIRPVSKWVVKVFSSLCFIWHKALCIFLPKNRKKNWDEWYDGVGHGLEKLHGHNLHKWL